MRNEKRTTPTEDRKFASEWVVVTHLIRRPVSLPAIFLSVEEFGHPRCRQYFEAISDLYEDGGASNIDPILIAGKLNEDPATVLDIVERWEIEAIMHDVEKHAAIVRRQAADRALRKAAVDIAAASEEGDDLYELARQRILAVERVEAGRSRHISIITKELIEELELSKAGKPAIDFLRWNDRTLDRLFLLPRGGVFTVGARPGEGKSIFLGWLKLKLLALGESLLCVSTEMLGREDHRRTVTQDVAVDVNDFLLDYNLTPGQHARYLKRLQDLQAKPVLFLDRTTRLADVCREIDRQRRLNGVTSVCIDHINEMHDPGSARHGRRQELDSCWLGLRRACQEGHDVPPATLFVASELTRPPKDKRHRKPTMDDLKGTGKGEEVSSVVAVIHDPWKHDPSQPDNELHIMVDKHRHGPRGALRFSYDRRRGHILGLKSDRSDEPLPKRDNPKQSHMVQPHWTEVD